MLNKRQKKGFTLIEILLVLIIVGVLAAMVVPNLTGKGKRARQSAAKIDIESNLPNILSMYEMDNGQYPSTEQGLKALIAKPSDTVEFENWDGPYIKSKKIPKDPWGREYVYVFPGAHNVDGYDLSSLGPDGIESKDDINNWGSE